MSPISSSPGWTTRKPNAPAAPPAAQPGFAQQLQALVQQGRAAAGGAARPGGMNSAAQTLLRLAGRP